MRKLLLLVLIGASIAVGYSFASSKPISIVPKEKQEILKFAIVSDSHSDNELLKKALSSAKTQNANFVIGLGDYSTVGTVEELVNAKKVFDESGLTYYLTIGDHDLWDSRDKGLNPTDNFMQVFGKNNHLIERDGVQIIIVDNSDIYTGISDATWQFLNSKLQNPNSKLTFVMAHKTPFHPDTEHIMGQDSSSVAKQAKEFLAVLENNKVDGFFAGDIHFFAQFKSPANAVKITTIGAVTLEKNFQGPRYAIVRVFDDYSWNVEDIEISQ